MRTAVSSYCKPIGTRAPYKVSTPPNCPAKSCPLCQQAGRPGSGHFLSECNVLPDKDRKYIAKARQIADILDDSPSTKVFRIQTCQSLYLDMFYSHHPVPITIDSGAKGNMIRHTLVQHHGCHMTSSSQSVHQADGSSPLHVVNETRLSFNREGREFTFEGLVIRNLDVDVLALALVVEIEHPPSYRHNFCFSLVDDTVLNVKYPCRMNIGQCIPFHPCALLRKISEK